ncbi:MAG TPA: tyrosine-type recombinase/integrase [Acidimicrobiales bacterium]|nr:tyrosine-type recombinase/integrase [Acidimicrobiales bacterium]
MASIEKRTTKAGEDRFLVRFRVDGRTVEKPFKTSKAAKEYRARVEADALDGILLDPRAGARTLNDYFASWLASRLVKGRPLTPSTRVGYERLYRRNIGPRLGGRPLRTIRPETVRTWHADVSAAAGRDQAAKSYRLLRAVLATAEADELIRQNPCRVRGGGQENTAERPLVATSLVLDLADAIEPPYRAMVLLAGFAGLRTGESLGLRRADVDLLHAEVRITRQAQEIAGSGRVVLAPKSEAGRRTVALPGVVVRALEQHLATFTDPSAEAPVFTGPEGGPLRRATFSRAWRHALAVTGAPAELRPHDLRHHAATLTARMPGITTKELMARIGHASRARRSSTSTPPGSATTRSRPSSTTSWRPASRRTGRPLWTCPTPRVWLACGRGPDVLEVP